MSEVKLNHFNLTRHSQVIIKTSYVIQLIDSFTGQSPILESLSVVIEGLNKQPIKKSNGFFVFTNLPAGEYCLMIRSAYYFEMKEMILISKYADPYLISLIPRPTYPNQREIPSLHLVVRNESNEPLIGAKVTATVVTRLCSVAKLAENSVMNGEIEVALAKSSEIFIGDHLLIQDKSQEISEYCSIAKKCENSEIYRLNDKLKNHYSRGALFLPVIKSITDEKGEATVFFRHYLVKSYDISVEVEHNKNKQHSILTMAEGESRKLEVIIE